MLMAAMNSDANDGHSHGQSAVMQAVIMMNFNAPDPRFPTLIIRSANISYLLSVVMEFPTAMIEAMKKTVTLTVTTAETPLIVSGACVQNDVTTSLSAMIKLTS